MKAISLWQPWASAIARGAKHIETRNWPTKYRGLLAIHAARTTTGIAVAVRQDRDLWRRVLGLEPSGLIVSALRALPFGAVVAVVELVRCVRTEDIDASYIYHGPNGSGQWTERDMGDYSPRRWAWVLRPVQDLPAPIPFRGSQGFFDVPDELLASQVASKGPTP